MNNTGAPWLIPYPDLTDPPDGATQIKAVATSVAANLTSIKNALNTLPVIQMGNKLGGPTSSTAATVGVTFPIAFQTIPVVVTNLSTAGTAIRWSLRAISTTATAFNLYLASTDNVAATFSASMDWVAHARDVVLPLTKTQQAPFPDWHYVTATCHNPACPKNNEPVAGILVPDIPEDWGWMGLYCGACGQEITDITPE